MLFIPTSFAKNSGQFTLGSSWLKPSLLHKTYVVFSHHFLSSSGSCHWLVLHGLPVSMTPPSMVCCWKLWVHIFICWKVTPKSSFSSLFVTDTLLLTHCTPIFFCSTETHTVKWYRSSSGAHVCLRWSLAYKRTGRAAQLPLSSTSVVSPEETFPLLLTLT